MGKKKGHNYYNKKMARDPPDGPTRPTGPTGPTRPSLPSPPLHPVYSVKFLTQYLGHNFDHKVTTESTGTAGGLVS